MNKILSTLFALIIAFSATSLYSGSGNNLRLPGQYFGTITLFGTTTPITFVFHRDGTFTAYELGLGVLPVDGSQGLNIAYGLWEYDGKEGSGADRTQRIKGYKIEAVQDPFSLFVLSGECAGPAGCYAIITQRSLLDKNGHLEMREAAIFVDSFTGQVLDLNNDGSITAADSLQGIELSLDRQSIEEAYQRFDNAGIPAAAYPTSP